MVAYGTGFLGFVQFHENPSVVLVTNYHVIGNEKIASSSLLEFEGMDMQIELKELLVETTYIC